MAHDSKCSEAMSNSMLVTSMSKQDINNMRKVSNRNMHKLYSPKGVT